MLLVLCPTLHCHWSVFTCLYQFLICLINYTLLCLCYVCFCTNSVQFESMLMIVSDASSWLIGGEHYCGLLLLQPINFNYQYFVYANVTSSQCNALFYFYQLRPVCSFSSGLCFSPQNFCLLKLQRQFSGDQQILKPWLKSQICFLHSDV